MGLLKAFGAAATSLGSSLQQAGALKHKEDLLEEQRNWEWKKMEWLADKESTAATTASRIDAYKTIMDQVGKEIVSIDKTLGGTPNVLHSGYDETYLNARRKALGDLSVRASSLLMGKSGISQDEITAFFGGLKKITTTKLGDDPKLTKSEEEAIAKQEAEGGGDGFFASLWAKGKPTGAFGQKAQQRGRDLAGAIKNIAWENDILLNAIKGVPGLVAEDSAIRQAIATVLGREQAISEAQSEDDINNIIADQGILSSIVTKIVDFVRDPLNRTEVQEEWEGTGPAPGEPDPDLNQRMLEQESAGIIDDSPTGILAQADKAKIDAEMQAAYDVGDETVADLQLPSDPEYLDSPSMHPDRDVVDTPRGETLETPPGTGEPHDVNYVEGRKAGTTNITSMTVGEIAEQYGYGTRVGMMALSYNEIIDLMKKHFYTNMSKKEVRERVDSLPFGSDLQKRLLYLSLGRD
jgi:hypothetical protein